MCVCAQNDTRTGESGRNISQTEMPKLQGESGARVGELQYYKWRDGRDSASPPVMTVMTGEEGK